MANEDAFTDMQDHILTLYENTEAQHSFVDETGAVYDCIPAEQQPSLRGSRGGIPSAPDAPKHEAAHNSDDERPDSLIDSPLGLDKKDQFGNIMHCPEGHYPDAAGNYGAAGTIRNVEGFFSKEPGSKWSASSVD